MTHPNLIADGMAQRILADVQADPDDPTTFDLPALVERAYHDWQEECGETDDPEDDEE